MIVAAVSIGGFFGSVHWLLDLAANFRPQQAVALMALGAIALLGNRGVASVLLLTAGVNAALVAPYLVWGHDGLEGEARIEVLSFNVGISNPNRGDVAEFIAIEDPDVVFIFESSFEWEDAIRAADLPLQIGAVVPRGRIAGVTVLARPELLPGAVEVSIGGEAAAVSLDLGGERVDFIGVHPPSPTTADRSERRDAILAAAAEWVTSRPGEVVLVGDLNATPWSHAFRNLRRNGGLTDTMRGAGLQPTWPDGWGWLAIPIDHILHTSGLAAADRRTGPAFGSAHRPVLVTIGTR
jgi:endonuclease/exonuclease/phosphatase (EEP) superfamily protein YafD